MNLPGENSITLSYNAIGAMLEAALNNGRDGEPRVRVTNVKRTGSFSDEITFEITTDPLPAPGPVTMPEPDPPVLLPASVDGIPL